jgi:Sulfotransferase domain
VSLRVIGAGLGRTGTHSLKLALERLLGAPCYHMLEVMRQPAHIPIWQRATAGEMPRWEELLTGYRATVDWPAAAFWKELSEEYPDALVLLSVREADDWWASADHTIFAISRREPPPDSVFSAQLEMAKSLFQTRFTPGWGDERIAKQAYLRHNDEVRRSVARDRLLEWHPGDGWEPICARLGLALPSEPFPHVNTKEEFRALTGLEATR